MTTATIPSASVQAKSRALLEMRAEWRTVHDKRTGQRRIVMPSLTENGRVYYVHPRGDACSCKAGQNGLYCGHRLAAHEASSRDALQAWLDDTGAVSSAANQAGITGYLDAASTGADHERATAAGHAARVATTRNGYPMPRKTYEQLFGED